MNLENFYLREYKLKGKISLKQFLIIEIIMKEKVVKMVMKNKQVLIFLIQEKKEMNLFWQNHCINYKLRMGQIAKLNIVKWCKIKI